MFLCWCRRILAKFYRRQHTWSSDSLPQALNHIVLSCESDWHLCFCTQSLCVHCASSNVTFVAFKDAMMSIKRTSLATWVGYCQSPISHVTHEPFFRNNLPLMPLYKSIGAENELGELQALVNSMPVDPCDWSLFNRRTPAAHLGTPVLREHLL